MALIFALNLRPLDSDGRIIPGQTALIVGMVKIRDLVAEFRGVTEDQEAVGETRRNIKLLLILGGQLHTVPLAVGCRTGTQVHRHIEDTALDHPDQLSLGVVDLIVQSPEHAFDGHTLIILHKDHIQTGLTHIVQVVGFHEVTPAVAVDLRFDDIKALNGAFGDCDLSHGYPSSSFR